MAASDASRQAAFPSDAALEDVPLLGLSPLTAALVAPTRALRELQARLLEIAAEPSQRAKQEALAAIHSLAALEADAWRCRTAVVSGAKRGRASRPAPHVTTLLDGMAREAHRRYRNIEGLTVRLAAERVDATALVTMGQAAQDLIMGSAANARAHLSKFKRKMQGPRGQKLLLPWQRLWLGSARFSRGPKGREKCDGFEPVAFLSAARARRTHRESRASDE